MGVVQLPDHVRDIIARQVAEGRFESEAAFIEEAVLRLADDVDAAEPATPAFIAAIEEGLADIAAGRCTTVASEGELKRFMADIMREVDEDVTLSDAQPSPTPN